VNHVQTALGGLDGKIIAVWGLAFKPRTDDVREAAALRAIEALVALGATVRATDPQAIDAARERRGLAGLLDRVDHLSDPYEACRGADALVVATEWVDYRAPDAARLRALMRGRHVFDGRNALTPEEIVGAGLAYRGVGRPQRG
jgi:UDPglucose 6-dehydrogenase